MTYDFILRHFKDNFCNINTCEEMLNLKSNESNPPG